ncbi:MAG: 23S rRNA (uracil(1939)-C(5))-methyltransferase RlmD [Clostridia bacterium]|nr:23S rRNA (uracil(1939)-C(5))-methyltransferase RlmD [Clostridia bacterium]
MIEKNCDYQGVVDDFGSNAEGVIHYEDKVVFVPFAIPNEKVDFKVLKVDKNIAYGKLLSVFENSPYRVSPKCPVFGKCGGCSFQHVEYSKTLEVKRQNVQNAFKKVALLNVEVNETVPSDKVYGYRNKLQLPVQCVNGVNTIGFYARNSHRIIPIEDCPINPEWTAEIIKVFKKYLSLNGVSSFDPISKKGLVREITVKQAGGLFITVVCTSEILPHKDLLIKLLNEKFDKYSLYLNVNNNENNVIYGEKFIKIYGQESFENELNGVKFKSGVRSFLQVNDGVCKKLYEKAVNEVLKDSPEIVIDAYSGAGITTAMIAKKAKKVYGIEIVKEAVDCADDLARFNGLSDNIKNYCGKTEEILPELIKSVSGKTAMLLDPPRKGCDEKVLKSILESKPERIVYVSCMPSTLARDVGVLCGSLKFGEKGIEKSEYSDGLYQIESVTPFDMFPQTPHVETVCLLTRK